MNHIYRLVWNAITACWVAVCETAKGRGKGGLKGAVKCGSISAATTAGLLVLLTPLAQAQALATNALQAHKSSAAHPHQAKPQIA